MSRATERRARDCPPYPTSAARVRDHANGAAADMLVHAGIDASYRLKPLLSPETRAARWAALEQTHTPQRVTAARQLAAMINFGHDLDAADQLAVAINRYGYQAVSNATTQVAAKSATNPHRHPATITAMLRGAPR